MKIQTMSIVVGTEACNAKCPFCVSKMTGKYDLPIPTFKNFDKACQFAKDSGVSTVLLTGKGEPTLYPSHITTYLHSLERYKFPFVELQTNGIILNDGLPTTLWNQLGLSLICLSLVHYEQKKNKAIYGKSYDLAEKIKWLHSQGFSVRMCIMMLKDYVDNMEEVWKMIDFCKTNEVEQLTIRAVEQPAVSADKTISDWVTANSPDRAEMERVELTLHDKGSLLMELPHSAKVFDVEGQNVCFSTCLTIRPQEGTDNIRQIIYYPDGHIRYDWRYKGAILL